MSANVDSLLDPDERPRIEVDSMRLAGFEGSASGRELQVERARFGDKPMSMCANYSGCPDELFGLGYRHTLSDEYFEHIEFEIGTVRGDKSGEVGFDGLVKLIAEERNKQG